MNTRNQFVMGLLTSLVLASACSAQVPPTPVAPIAPVAPANLWSYFCLNADQKAALKNCFCNSPLGQMTSGAAGPMAAMSGGLITNRCALNAIKNDLSKPAVSSEGAAARIKQDEADAQARRESVRFLGTVDCNYWPEATEALVKSLRKDPNECVRFEAALSLRNGCCCNEKTIYALEMCVAGSDKDGAPIEMSDRVRNAATDALARCPAIQKEIEKKKKNGDSEKTEKLDPAEFYRRVAQLPREQVVAGARDALVVLQQANKLPASVPGAPVAALNPPVVHAAPRATSVSAIISNAFSPSAVSSSPASASMAGNASQSRQPFFTGLTKALTGRQDSEVPVRPYMPVTRTEGTVQTTGGGTLGTVEIVPAR